MFPNVSKVSSKSVGNLNGPIRWVVFAIFVALAGVALANQGEVSLSNLIQTYTGSPREVTVSPAGLNYTITYAGSTTPPTNAGSYPVVVSVADPVQTKTATLIINKASQTITFAPVTKTFGDAPFGLAATSSSGLPITYTSSATTVATISGATVTIMRAGATSINASQSGDTNYLAATSVSQTLTVNKRNLNFNLVLPAAKTYGDAPFAANATVSNGFSVTKWESADPSVATVSPTGEVTIVGSGQTSIIASIPSSESANYDPTWIARPLNVARSSIPLPSGTQTVTFNGAAQGLDPSTLPSGLASQITYRNTSASEPAATPQVVFQNGPDTLALSYLSNGLQAKGYWGMAKYISLGGTARKLHSCDVTLVSWARYDTSSPYGYKPWADANPSKVVIPAPNVSIPGNSGGFYHPVTLAFYGYENVSGTETYRLLTSQTIEAFIPWRPATRADGTAYPHNGSAFRVSFNFPDGVILPQDVWVAASFNTNTHGVAPIGAGGPYDALNISNPEGLQAGTDLFASFALLYDDWRWQNGLGGGGPMLRLRATPTSATSSSPVNASSYEVRSKASAFGGDPWSASTLVINKAPYVGNLTNLIQIRDGNPKPVTLTTTPSGIASSLTYSGSVVVPSALGTYPVTATSADPNYEGQASGTLQIGDSYASWQNAAFAGSGLPPEQIIDTADPDRDGLSNFLEYASNLNPLWGNQPTPVGFAPSGNHFAFTYRRNLHALDLDYAIQGNLSLSNALSWNVVTPLEETILSDDGSTRVIRATVAKPGGQGPYFVRLRVTR